MDTASRLEQSGEAEEPPTITFSASNVPLYDYDKAKEELVLRFIRLPLPVEEKSAPEDESEDVLMEGQVLDLQRWAEAVRIEHEQTLAGPSQPKEKAVLPVRTPFLFPLLRFSVLIGVNRWLWLSHAPAYRLFGRCARSSSVHSV